jgi:predicted membrane protein
MRIKTGFYFIGWLLNRLFRKVTKLPVKVHRAFMNTYQEHVGLGFVAWLITTAVVLLVLGAGTLVIGPATIETLEASKTITVVASIISIIYFVFCILLDQYEKFETERMASWHTLKD